MSDNQKKRDEFAVDWNEMIAIIARFSAKHNLPVGELIYPPVVLDNLRDVCQERILGTLINRGVRVRFGRFEPGETFRQY